MEGQLWWYVARASGLLAAALLGAGVVWGLAPSTNVLRDPSGSAVPARVTSRKRPSSP